MTWVTNGRADESASTSVNDAGILAPPDEGEDCPKIHNNLFSILLTSQIAWDAGSRTVGGSNYTMHYASRDVIAGRINGAAG